MKIRRSISFLSLASLILFSCKPKEAAKTADLSSIELLRGEIILCGSQELGDVNFAVAGNPEAQKAFNLGLSLLHSFEYEEAEKAFVKAIDLDPKCVMAYWGVGMSNFHALWNQPGTDYLEKGSKILDIAQTLEKSEKEQDYLDAIHVFYKDYQTLDRNKRKVLFEHKMEALYKKYIDDIEAAIFYALALTATADPADKTYANQLKAGKILETLAVKYPKHPGIAHYIIHTYDCPELASLALPTARKYASIAPASSHAQHMPSHIFTRLGLWDESINSNLKSMESAVCYGQSVDTSMHWDEEVHAMDYLIYAYLQNGDNEKVQKQMDYLKTFKKIFPNNVKVAYSVAAIPARFALENRNWAEASTLQFPALIADWDSSPWEKSILHFARGIGAVRSGNVAAANNELIMLEKMHQKLIVAGEAYKANQVKIQANAVQAWIYFATGKQAEATKLMEETAQMEYKTGKHPVTPGEVIPAGELLGDLYMEMKNPAKALIAYEYDLQQHPNRFNGLYGAAIAAKSLGQTAKAKQFFGQIVAQTKHSNSQRKEVIEARNYSNLYL